jgi:hypothetical protein
MGVVDNLHHLGGDGGHRGNLSKILDDALVTFLGLLVHVPDLFWGAWMILSWFIGGKKGDKSRILRGLTTVIES